MGDIAKDEDTPIETFSSTLPLAFWNSLSIGVIDNLIISPFLKTSIFCFLISDSTIIFCNCLNDKIDWSLNLVIKSPDFNPALLAGETGITEPIIGTVGKGPIVSINTPLRFII